MSLFPINFPTADTIGRLREETFSEDGCVY